MLLFNICFYFCRFKYLKRIFQILSTHISHLRNAFFKYLKRSIIRYKVTNFCRDLQAFIGTKNERNLTRRLLFILYILHRIEVTQIRLASEREQIVDSQETGTISSHLGCQNSSECQAFTVFSIMSNCNGICFSFVTNGMDSGNLSFTNTVNRELRS